MGLKPGAQRPREHQMGVAHQEPDAFLGIGRNPPFGAVVDRSVS